MSVMASRYVLKLRGFGRRFGLNRLLAWFLGSQGYETKLANAIAASVRRGDCIWDVGANVGYYTIRFSEFVGDQGRVIAFEPSPQNRQRLGAAVQHVPNVQVLSVGLSDRPGRGTLLQGADDLGTTSRIVAAVHHDAGDRNEIKLESGDCLIASGSSAEPNVIKIDVEGHELEVLRGLRSTLSRPSLRHLFVEVHFGLLEARGLPHAAHEIESLLGSSDFRVRWLDPSHLHAFRAG